jgi:hypothetical protein
LLPGTLQASELSAFGLKVRLNPLRSLLNTSGLPLGELIRLSDDAAYALHQAVQVGAQCVADPCSTTPPRAGGRLR